MTILCVGLSDARTTNKKEAVNEEINSKGSDPSVEDLL